MILYSNKKWKWLKWLSNPIQYLTLPGTIKPLNDVREVHLVVGDVVEDLVDLRRRPNRNFDRMWIVESVQLKKTKRSFGGWLGSFREMSAPWRTFRLQSVRGTWRNLNLCRSRGANEIKNMLEKASWMVEGGSALYLTKIRIPSAKLKNIRTWLVTEKRCSTSAIANSFL